MQGMDVDGQGHIFISMTTKLIKLTSIGEVLLTVDMPGHGGDIVHVDGNLYIPVNLGYFNGEGKADNYIFVYSSNNLELINIIEVNNFPDGIGSISYKDGIFYVGGGRNWLSSTTDLGIYDTNFNQINLIKLPIADRYGLQTMSIKDNVLYVCGWRKEGSVLYMFELPSFELTNQIDFNCDMGIVKLDSGYLIGEGSDRFADDLDSLDYYTVTYIERDLL